MSRGTTRWLARHCRSRSKPTQRWRWWWCCNYYSNIRWISYDDGYWLYTSRVLLSVLYISIEERTRRSGDILTVELVRLYTAASFPGMSTSASKTIPFSVVCIYTVVSVRFYNIRMYLTTNYVAPVSQVYNIRLYLYNMVGRLWWSSLLIFYLCTIYILYIYRCIHLVYMKCNVVGCNSVRFHNNSGTTFEEKKDLYIGLLFISI